MGSPVYPTQQQLQTLNQSSQFVAKPIEFTKIDANTIMFNVTLDMYSVLVIDIQY